MDEKDVRISRRALQSLIARKMTFAAPGCSDSRAICTRWRKDVGPDPRPRWASCARASPASDSDVLWVDRQLRQTSFLGRDNHIACTSTFFFSLSPSNIVAAAVGEQGHPPGRYISYRAVMSL